MSVTRPARWCTVLMGAAALISTSAAGAPKNSGAVPAPITYAALGDSYASGQGTGSYSLSSTCKRGTKAYPALLPAARANTTLTFLACSGATISSVRSQLSSVDPTKTTHASVTVGGNDLNFSGLVSQCVSANCAMALTSTTARVEGTLRQPLSALYTEIRTRAARVVVLGYPRLFTSTSCTGTTGIDATERRLANSLVDEIDRVVGAAVADTNDTRVTYSSALGPFAEHEVCSPSPWVNGLNVLSTGESFHPNATGHASGYLPMLRAITG